MCGVDQDFTLEYLLEFDGRRHRRERGCTMKRTIVPMDELEKMRRKLKFRAWHRGTREADLIMGQFADANLDTMSQDDLDQFDALLEAQDLDVYNWIIGKEPVPPEFDNDVMKQLLMFDFVLPGIDS